MRILYIWHAAVEKEYRKLVWKMAEKGHEVHLVTAHRWTESSRDQRFQRLPEDRYITTYPLLVMFRNHIRSFFFVNILRMAKILLGVKPEVVYLKEEPYSFAAWQWVWMVRVFSPRSVIVVESDENLEGKHPFLYRWIERYVLSRIHGMASVPTAGLDLYKRKGFVGKQFKTSYFVNTEIFFPLSRKEAKTVFPEIREESFAVGYVGRITPEKGLDTVIEALGILKKKGLFCNLYLLGKVAQGYREELVQLLQREGVEDRVYFLEARPMEKLVFFYNAIDVLVLPSKSTSWWIEQFGRVIVEAQACGTPVVGSSSGEIPIVIGDERMVFPEGDSQQLADILERFVRKEYAKERLSEHLVTQVKERFSLEQVAENKLTIMEEMLHHHVVRKEAYH
ncbi:MAG: glycosyltransferase family 4 protein [Brevinematales bacterium]|nr:glycosyltransferase family 4 protein [Brevinematales bacterium]